MAQPLIHACLTQPILSHAFETVSVQRASMAPLCQWHHLDPFCLCCLFFLKGVLYSGSLVVTSSLYLFFFLKAYISLGVSRLTQQLRALAIEFSSPAPTCGLTTICDYSASGSIADF